MKIPEIRIQFSWLLFNEVSQDLFKLHATKNDKKLSDYQYYEKYTEDYRDAWLKYEKNTLHGMVDSLGVEFYKPVIDVSLAPWIKPISNPLIISFYYKPDQFIDTLTHELYHNLLTDNTALTTKQNRSKRTDLREEWAKMFGSNHSFTTLVHIPVHAGMKYIFLDVFKEPQRLERDIKHVGKWPDYKKAWDYVEQNDYKAILDKLKSYYANLA